MTSDEEWEALTPDYCGTIIAEFFMQRYANLAPAIIRGMAADGQIIEEMFKWDNVVDALHMGIQNASILAMHLVTRDGVKLPPRPL